MIGFKTIEDFTFDDCVKSLNRHRAEGTLPDEELLCRYNSLLNDLKVEKLHAKETCEYVKQNSIIPVKKRLFGSYFIDANKRNSITNLVLYLLLLASFIAIIVLITFTNRFGWEYVCEEYKFGIIQYKYVIIPGFLISAFAFLGVSKIIKWKKSGITILTVSFIVIPIPIICNEFIEFICFSVPSILGVALLWCILKLKKNGISTWDRCKAEPRWVKYIRRTILFMWLFMIILLPPIVGLYTGFRSNIYSNGMRCLDAYFNSNPYYSYTLYQRILLGSDFSDDIYEKQSKAEIWLSNAQYLNDISDRYYDRFDDEFSEPSLFLNNLIFIIKNKSDQDAIDYISSMKDKIDMSIVFQYLNREKRVTGNYTYYRRNQEKITSLLNQAEIYEVVEATK